MLQKVTLANGSIIKRRVRKYKRQNGLYFAGSCTIGGKTVQVRKETGKGNRSWHTV